MIQLSRLNSELFILNAIMIEQIQTLPDTTITLINGKKMVVKNPESEVIALITDYYRKIGIEATLKEVGETSETIGQGNVDILNNSSRCSDNNSSSVVHDK